MSADPTHGSRRSRQPRMPIEVRREQVLDATLKLIVERGYPAATMEAVARQAELAKPRVYSAYPGRGPLLRALLEREERRVVTALAEAMPPRTRRPGCCSCCPLMTPRRRCGSTYRPAAASPCSSCVPCSPGARAAGPAWINWILSWPPALCWRSASRPWDWC